MKQAISDYERDFIMDGFKQKLRSDGRSNLDWRPFETEKGSIPEAFGSSTVCFGEQRTQIMCSIKADV
jgi:exosome complex RNA-binding protein Rrp42 (RNase PH superfamily)